MYDVIVIGAGPAGLAAATYTARHHLKTMIIAPDLAGKAAYRLTLPWMESHEVINGEESVEQLRTQLLAAHNVTRHLDTVEQVFRHDEAFHVVATEGGTFKSRVLIVATGVTPRALGVPGERALLWRGVSYSVASHAPLFVNRRVVVVGDNLRALRATAELCTIAEHVTLIAPEQIGIGSYSLGQRLMSNPRVTTLIHHQVVEIIGESSVKGVQVVGPDQQPQLIACDGVFIEHGLVAQTNFVSTLVERNTSGHITVDDRGATRCPGLFAAGDITSSACSEQILIALGEGTRAGVSAVTYLLEVAQVHEDVNV